ncbi:Hsp20/alpha crystallin family protein [Pirellulales bacterium]|nr:Hsp20/alpha crystallin family protein [Pirellulales bacterium]
MNSAASRNRVREFLPHNWNEVDSLLNQFFGPKSVASHRPHFASAALWEDSTGYRLELDLPGVSRDDVEITVDKGELRVAAERKAVDEDRNSLADERLYGKIERSVKLPELVNPESIDAKLADGVLSVSIAKKPEAQPRRIEIK